MVDVSFFAHVITNDDEYIFFLFDYPVDTIEPENEGVYGLRVARKVDAHKQIKRYWTEIKLPGIYVAE